MSSPKLRFKGFTEEWVNKELGEITIWKSGGTPSKDNDHYWNGDIPWISASTMRGIEYSDSTLKISNEGLKKGSKLAKKGSLLILVRGSMLFNKIPIGIAMRDLAFNQDVKSIEVDNSSTAKYILFWFISKENKILNLVTGTGIGAGKIDLFDLKKLSLSIPQLEEQEKIAIFFTTIDQKLNLLKEKKEKLEHYKKGVMQQIFSQKLRFKDDQGNEFPEWEDLLLGEIVNITTGKLDANAMSVDGKYRFYTCAKDYYFINKFAFDMEALLISGNGANVGYIHHYIGKFNAYQRTYVLGDFKNCNVIFLKYFLEKNLSTRILLEKKAGNTPYIVLSTLTEMNIVLPSLPEQEKIANFLSTLDAKINLVETQIKKTELWKKGLLQQMFV